MQFQQQHQPPAAYPGGPPPMGASPQGAPPYKRTRYDSMGAPQGQPPMSMGQSGPMGPPPALPPLNSGGPGGFGDRNGTTRGRGGYGGPPPIRGGPAMARSGYMGSPTHSNDGYGGSGQSYPSPGGPANGAGRGGGSAGSYRGGRGGGDMGRPNGLDSRGSGRAALPPPPSFARGGPGVGPPANAPYGPSSARANDRNSSRSARGAFDARGRPLSGLPGGGRGGSAYGRGSDYRTSAMYDAPKGPRSATRPSSGREAGGSQPRKERKWGKDPAQPNGRDDVKRTLTDFRISGLNIPEIEWQWKAEILQAVVKTIVEVAEAAEPEPVESAAEASSSANVAPAPAPEPSQSELSAPALAEPASSSPEKPSVDMSIDEMNPADLVDAPASEDAPSDVKPDIASTGSPETKKKLTKKEKNAQAAAKRAATALAKKEAAAAAAAAAAVAEAEGDEVKSENDERADSPTSTMRKDGKHGRDDEEESLVITDNTAAKKVKPDTGEVITLESLGLDMDGVETTKPAATDDASVVPAALVVPTGPKSLAIPTGPAADANRSTPAPPPNRENSRLRIYFASPVSSVSTYSAPPASERARSVKENTEPPASTAPSVDGTAATDDASEATIAEKAADQPAEPESAPAAEGVKEEDDDVDGVAFEVDGQTVPVPVSVPDAPVTLTIPVDDSDDDSDEVQSALLDVKPRPDGEAASPDPSSTGAPVLPGENASYPPNPYPSEDVAKSEAANADGAPAEPELMPPEPSADRISISYARNTRRMVLDADVVDKVTIFRSEGRIELSVAIHPATLGNDSALDEFRICRGILVEALDPENDDYIVIDRASLELAWRQQAAEHDPAEPTDQAEPAFLDPLLPPLHHLLAGNAPTAVDLLQGEGLSVSTGFNNTHITIVATLDRQNPLTEARWVKTGEVEPWIASLNPATGKQESVSEWRGKITISGPDPPPTIQQALETWAQSSTVGTLDERNGFVSGHMADIDNVFEILLRLTRGDRAGPSYHASAMQPSSVGALAATLSAPYAEHQTQVSLAVLAMFRLSVETAAKAGIPQKEVEKQVGEIVRTIPYHLIFKSLDGMFREQKKRS